MEDTQIRRRACAPDQEIRPHRCIGILRKAPMRALARLSSSHGADIGIELAEASAPKRALRFSLATPKGARCV